MRKNIGHRLGGQNKENENTIHALYSTLNLIGSKNFRYWETDVRESKDGILYCFHDDFIEGKNIDELTWDEICISGQNLGNDDSNTSKLDSKKSNTGAGQISDDEDVEIMEKP